VPVTSTVGPAATAVGDIKEDLPGMGGVDDQPETVQPGRLEQTIFAEKPLAAPATRKLARDLGIDLRVVRPSGPQGRVTQDDVKQAASAVAPRVGASSPAFAPAWSKPAGAPQKITSPEGAIEERVALRGMRKRIFEQMARSKHTAAHFTFVEECDASALKALREKLRPAADKQGVAFSYLPFIVKACVAALRKHPILNSAFDETTGEIVFRKYYNVGIATSTESGLIVPVIKNADKRSLLEVAAEIQRLAQEAKAGKAKLEDLQGSTFTITSLGALGGLFATPVLNFPEVAILGVHQIKQKPVVRDGQIVIGDVMLLSLSFDHRIVDGHIGAAFAYEVIRYLENPDLLMLEMV
jgi:pyruvate dehydrogenase E2 component (dihydrolipoamide acetyltransferase)